MTEEETREQSDVVEESMNDVPPADDADELFLSPEDSDAEEVDQISAKLSDLEAQVAALTEERDDFKNRMIRAAADLENFRKRSNREKDEMRRYGIDKVVGELIPVVDNFERAIQHTEPTETNKSLFDGVHMIYRMFVTALAKHGVEGFEAVGQPFDPQRHEAIQQVETDEFPQGTVVEQFQKGYFLHDRLIRPALVSVSKKPSGETAEVAAPVSEPEEVLGEQISDSIPLEDDELTELERDLDEIEEQTNEKSVPEEVVDAPNEDE